MNKTKALSKVLAVVMAIMLCLAAVFAAPAFANVSYSGTYNLTALDTDYSDNTVTATLNIEMNTSDFYSGAFTVVSDLPIKDVTSNDIKVEGERYGNVYMFSNYENTLDNGNKVQAMSFSLAFDTTEAVNSANYYSVSVKNVELSCGGADVEGEATMTAETASVTFKIGEATVQMQNFATQSYIIEPWGFSFLAIMEEKFGDAAATVLTKDNLDAQFKEVGAYVLVRDSETKPADQITLEDFDVSNPDVKKVKGAVTAEGYISADYRESIYTYEMESKKLQVCFYAVDNNNQEYKFAVKSSDNANISHREINLRQCLDKYVSGNFDANVKSMANAMITFYNATMTYRAAAAN